MSSNILQTIVDKRKQDIASLGYEFGFDIPEKRTRKIHPFVQSKGVILEVKRASPSKGDIAPDLDSGATALAYSRAGARAISCLTETHYFKGTLQDLMKVCAAVDAFEKETGLTGPAVLRKDFLLDENDVEVAFRSGADAVLLIARILDKQTLLKMAQKAASLGISVLLEVRSDDDLQKLEYVMARVEHQYILCGVNSRDLRDFTIDLLTPARMLKKIKQIAPDARVTFESGILSPSSAGFAASMGFNAILLGEAAARNPQIAKEYVTAFEKTPIDMRGDSWVRFASRPELSDGPSKRPLVKICGITNLSDAVFATECGADFLGFILFNKSRRNTNASFIQKCKAELEKKFGDKRPALVAVVADNDSDEYDQAINLACSGTVDFIQLHGIRVCKEFIKNPDLNKLPHYCAVNIKTAGDLEDFEYLNSIGEPRILIDAISETAVGGTGIQVDSDLVKKVSEKHKLWIAGGITADNVNSIIKNYNPELIDVSSSVESEPGIKNVEKLKCFFDILSADCK